MHIELAYILFFLSRIFITRGALMLIYETYKYEEEDIINVSNLYITVGYEGWLLVGMVYELILNPLKIAILRFFSTNEATRTNTTNNQTTRWRFYEDSNRTIYTKFA